MNRQISPAARLLRWWHRLEGKPAGKWLFGRLVRFAIPYTGTVRPRVVTVEPGYARVEMNDRRRVRNHLSSIHAIAIANIGELSGGLAMTATLPPEVRSILTAIHVDFLKKARGPLVAECRCEVPEIKEPLQYQLRSSVRDAGGDDVAIVTATWLLSPPRAR